MPRKYYRKKNYKRRRYNRRKPNYRKKYQNYKRYRPEGFPD